MLDGSPAGGGDVPQRISFRSRPRYDAVSGLDPQHKLARDLRISFRQGRVFAHKLALGKV